MTRQELRRAVRAWHRSILPRGSELDRLSLAEWHPGDGWPYRLVELDPAAEATRLVRAVEWDAAALLFLRQTRG